jgi:hypothetical protein
MSVRGVAATAAFREQFTISRLGVKGGLPFEPTSHRSFSMRLMLSRRFALPIVTTILAFALTLAPSSTQAAAYASGVTIAGTTVNFILNDTADTVTVSINGGPPISLNTTKGAKTFNLGSASDKFSIVVSKNEFTGYTIPTGGTVAPPAGGLSVATAAGGFALISEDSNPLVQFNSPRGITVATNPANPQFGTTYIANSQVGTPGGRPAGDGLYAVRADQSDAFGFGNTATITGFEVTPSTNSPYRLAIGGDHNLYLADYADANGGVFRMSGSLTNPTRVLAGVGGPTTLPAGQNHGSTTAVFVSGSASGTTLYTIDEDLTTFQVTGAGSTTDRNSLWRYDIGASALPYAAMPTRLSSVLLNLTGFTNDLDRGLNGNFYLSQFRSNGFEAGIIVLSPDGSTVLFDSLTQSRLLLADGAAPDIFRNVQAIAVSPDQKYLAAMLNNSQVGILPLDANGIPRLVDRLVVYTNNDINSGRDIAFDAAGNIHYVSSGQQLYRVLSPGGMHSFETSWNGSELSFAEVPEPSSALLLGAASLLLARRRRTLASTP